jgi:hypothetical protein
VIAGQSAQEGGGVIVPSLLSSCLWRDEVLDGRLACDAVRRILGSDSGLQNSPNERGRASPGPPRKSSRLKKEPLRAVEGPPLP